MSILKTNIAMLQAENAKLRGALAGMIHEFDKMTRYGSPMAKAANENLQRARAALASVQGKSEEG